MRKFLIVSHGEFAGGMRSALELIAGVQPEVVVLQAYVGENKSVEEELGGILGDGAEWVVFTDVLGGSVTNQVLRTAAGLGIMDSVHVVAGMNLPLVIDVVLADPGEPVRALLSHAIGMAREQLVYVNELIGNNND
jgi:fructoselysine and glucoselysine-specific PTS system IIA component